MCDKIVDVCLLAQRFVPDWLATSKILEILHEFIFSNNDINFDYIDSDIVTFFNFDIEINTIGVNNIT